MPETSPALPKIDTRHRIELTEGVEIWLPIAGPAVRAMAYLIDLLIRWGILIAAVIVIGLCSTFLGKNVAQGLMLLFTFWWTWFFYVFFSLQ